MIKKTIFMAGLYITFLFATTGITESSTDQCPPEHYRANGSCSECPPGKFGFNCSMPCEPLYYGRGCKYQCNCLPDFCDPRIGCIETSTGVSAVGETVSVTSTDVPPTEGPVHAVFSLVLLIVILAIVGCNFAASMSLLWRFTTKFHLPHHHGKTEKESTAQGTIEEIEMIPDAYESPIIPTERQEIRIYTELN